jgi:choline dehydrogenase-like flavoprotein
MTPADFAAKSYDYVIIGGGTAGLTLAARLTEDPAITVAVLEAGPNRLNDSTILTPALARSMIGDPKYDWRHTTVPQASFLPLSITPSPALPKRDRVGSILANPRYVQSRRISKIAKSLGRAEKYLGGRAR